MKTPGNAVEMSHEIIRKAVRQGDTAVDATAGNGHDTLFLASLVGETGRVYSFDIQKKALEASRERVQNNGLSKRVKFIPDGHENMESLIGHEKGNISAVVFNLGYLPGGDHFACTRYNTTIEAIEQALQLLQINGVITIVVYHGGDTGFEERDRVLAHIKKLDSRGFTVMKTEFHNQANCPPIFLYIKKLADE